MVDPIRGRRLLNYLIEAFQLRIQRERKIDKDNAIHRCTRVSLHWWTWTWSVMRWWRISSWNFRIEKHHLLGHSYLNICKVVTFIPFTNSYTHRHDLCFYIFYLICWLTTTSSQVSTQQTNQGSIGGAAALRTNIRENHKWSFRLSHQILYNTT